MNLLSKIQKNDFYIFKILLFIIFSFLIFLRLYYKTFFDDEIATIGIINDKNIFSIYTFVNSWDVSPPLSYILIYLGEKIFGFQYAPLLFLPLQIYCINSFVKDSNKIFLKSNEIKLFYLLSVILNPIFILWCTSLRWYSLWVPLALYIIGKIFFQKKRDYNEIFLILSFITLMFHLNYLTIIFIFCLGISNYKQIKNEIFNFIKNKTFLFLLIFLINIPQLYYFLSNHLINSSSQYGDYILSFSYPIITTVFGNSVFPLELIAILFLFILIITFFQNINILGKIFKPLKNLLIFSSIFFIIIFLFKLGHKPRHSIILNYVFIICFFINLYFLKNLILIRSSIFIFIFFIFFGIKNTIKEENLIKNNINLPTKKILEFLNNEKLECETKYVFTYNLNIKFYIKDKSNYVININDFKKNNYNCTFIIKTFIANDNLDEVQLVNEHFIKAKSLLRLKNLKYDKFSTIKEKIFKNKIKNNFIVEILY